jgi:hypothetical protein
MRGDRGPKGFIRPPDPQDVLRRRSHLRGPKICVKADRDDANEPQLEVRAAPPMGSTDGATVFAVDEQGSVTAAGATVGALTVNGAAGVAGKLTAGTVEINGATTGSNAPALVLKDAAGNVRSIIDHIGYRRGHVTEYYEDWLNIPGLAAAAGVINGAASSGVARVAYSLVAGTSIAWDTTIPGCVIKLATNNAANGSTFGAWSQMPFYAPQNFHSMAIEFDLCIGNASAIDWQIGMSSALNGTPIASNAVTLVYQTTDATYQLCTGNGSAFTKTNTVVAPNTSAADKITMEFHGSASPYGSKARMFVNGAPAPVAETNSNMLNVAGANLYFAVVGTAKSGANNGRINLSPVRVIFNRSLSIPLV